MKVFVRFCDGSKTVCIGHIFNDFLKIGLVQAVGVADFGFVEIVVAAPLSIIKQEFAQVFEFSSIAQRDFKRILHGFEQDLQRCDLLLTVDH